jgi:hypothetical protein
MNDLTIPSTFRGFLPPYPTITPMSEADTLFFIKLAMLPPQAVLDGIKGGGFLCNVCVKRLNAYGVQFSPKLMLLLLLNARNPAHAVAAAYTLALIDAAGDGQLEFTDVCMKYFPEGLPDMSKFNDLWESQKITDEQRKAHPGIMDNLLDVAPWPKRETVSA